MTVTAPVTTNTFAKIVGDVLRSHDVPVGSITASAVAEDIRKALDALESPLALSCPVCEAGPTQPCRYTTGAGVGMVMLDNWHGLRNPGNKIAKVLRGEL